METMQSLITKNDLFDRNYGLRSSDLELCNYIASVIEGTRSEKEPRAGDRIQCCGPKKEYLFGHMEQDLKQEYTQICVQPYTPFVSCNKNIPIINSMESEDFPRFSTSGGYWISCNELEMFEYIGKAKKLFKVWENAGWCAGGAVNFEAEVNIWKLFKESIY